MAHPSDPGESWTDQCNEARRMVGLSQFPASAPDGWRNRDLLVALAQVHATVALAVAVGQLAASRGDRPDNET